MPAQVFVSWSHREGEADAFVRGLQSALSAAKLDPWVDWTALEPGDTWHPTIARALQFCDAAVLVLSPASLTAPFVHYEAAVLRTRQQSFGIQLIPVLLDGVTLQDLDRPELRPHELERLQVVSASGREDAAIASIVTKLAGKLAPSPFARVGRDLASRLTNLSDETAVELLESLELLPELFPMTSPDVHTRLVAGMILAARKHYLAALRAMAEAGIDPEILVDLADRLQPFRWVNAAAVHPLHAGWTAHMSEPKPASGPVFVINGTEVPFTPSQYRRRAFLRATHAVPIASIPESPDDLRRDIEKALSAKMPGEPLLRGLSVRHDDAEPIVVDVRLQPFEAEDLALLRTRLPTLMWFVLCGEPPPPAADTYTLLQPPLPEDAELDAQSEGRRAHDNARAT